jgi:hypothetical protein
LGAVVQGARTKRRPRAPSDVRPPKMRVVATVMAHPTIQLPCQTERVQMPESLVCTIEVVRKQMHRRGGHAGMMMTC